MTRCSEPDATRQDISYLKHGSQSQVRVYQLLSRLAIIDALSAYGATLIGSYPIAVDLPDSDIDIACEISDVIRWERDVAALYGHFPRYAATSTERDDGPALIIRFEAAGLTVELFGQTLPVVRQRGYRHMLVEQRLLALGGEAARAEIGLLRVAGMKTEPAFARLFRLPGDPYQTLYEMSDWSDGEMLLWWQSRGSDDAGGF